MRQDDRGITLLEMIIAVGATVIVMGAATLFIRNALRGYELASETINLKVEAQTLMEQFSTWVMEGNYYEVNKDMGTFVIYHIPRVGPVGIDADLMGEPWMWIFWHDGNNNNLYAHKETTVPPESDGSVGWSEVWTGSASLISDCVEEFDVVFEEGGAGSSDKVKVTLRMKLGNLEYEIKDEINVRNEVRKP